MRVRWRWQVADQGCRGHGIEADFTTILSTKQIPIAKLTGFENDLLHITEEEKEDGFKYVFVTRVSKDSVGERCARPWVSGTGKSLHRQRPQSGFAWVESQVGWWR